MSEPVKYPGFEVYYVNDYAFFNNQLEGRDFLINALNIQKAPRNSGWDGKLNGRMVRIMPVNRRTEKKDVEDLFYHLPHEKYEKLVMEHPDRAVENVTLVCIGHTPEVEAGLVEGPMGYKLDINIFDVLEVCPYILPNATACIEAFKLKNKLAITKFYPVELMQKFNSKGKSVENWRQVADSVMIDWNYDGEVLHPTLWDIPKTKDDLVKGLYTIPENAGRIRIKITDLTGKSFEADVNNSDVQGSENFQLWECPLCGNVIGFPYAEVPPEEWGWKFCPYCGERIEK